MAGAVFSSNSKSSTNEVLNKYGPTSTSALLSSSSSISNMMSGMNKFESLTRERKLEKISNYSPCQFENCKCNGFKDNNNNSSSTKEELCKTCSHEQSVYFY